VFTWFAGTRVSCGGEGTGGAVLAGVVRATQVAADVTTSTSPHWKHTATQLTRHSHHVQCIDRGNKTQKIKKN